MDLDPRRLIELLGIARHGSYSKAAAAQGVSQPALSNSIAVLEKALGESVLDRTRRGSTLTDIGTVLVGHAETLEFVLSRAAEDVRLIKQGLEGSLQIGISPIASVGLVPTAVARLKLERPNILVEVHERPDDELLANLRKGKIDVVISPTAPQDDYTDLQAEIVLRDEPVVIGRADGRLKNHRSVKLDQLIDYQWVLPSAHTAMWRYMESMFLAENVPWPQNFISTNSVSVLKALIMNMDAVSISSPRVMKLEQDTGYLICIPLQIAHFSREVVLRTRRAGSTTAVAARFLEILRETAADMRIESSATHACAAPTPGVRPKATKLKPQSKL